MRESLTVMRAGAEGRNRRTAQRQYKLIDASIDPVTPGDPYRT